MELIITPLIILFLILLITAISHGKVTSLPGRIISAAEYTAALYECALFSLVTKAIAISSDKSVSNHSILSLDIIYSFSLIILFMFHILKDPSYLPLFN